MASPERLKKLTTAAAQRQEGIIVLEDIRDPHNAQAVSRTCEVFGISKVALIQKPGSRFDPETAGWRASCTANKWMEFYQFESAPECYEFLHANDYVTYATVVEPRDDEEAAKSLSSIYETDFTEHKKIALCFGNERNGLTEEAINLSKHRLTIPRQGMIESLNLSVTVAIFVFELCRQRRAVGLDKFLIAESEREFLLEKWLQNKKAKI